MSTLFSSLLRSVQNDFSRINISNNSRIISYTFRTDRDSLGTLTRTILSTIKNMIPTTHVHRRANLRYRLSMYLNSIMSMTDWISLTKVHEILNSYYRHIRRPNLEDFNEFVEKMSFQIETTGSGTSDFLDEFATQHEDVTIKLEIDVSSLLTNSFGIEDLVNYIDFDDDDLISSSRSRHYRSNRFRSGRGISSLINPNRAIASLSGSRERSNIPINFERVLQSNYTLLSNLTGFSFR